LIEFSALNEENCTECNRLRSSHHHHSMAQSGQDMQQQYFAQQKV